MNKHRRYKAKRRRRVRKLRERLLYFSTYGERRLTLEKLRQMGECI